MRTKTLNPRRVFCESFEWAPKFAAELKWYDGTGVYSGLDGGRLAKIELAQRFAGFAVTIVHKLNGAIDSHDFRFKDYLPLEDAKDVRNEGKGAPGHPMPPDLSFHPWEDLVRGDVHWYCIAPRTTRPFCEAIENYVAALK